MIIFWDNYNFKPDADKIDDAYEGDLTKYVDVLFILQSCKRAFAESEYSVTMNFVRFCIGVAKVKRREYRESKIDSIIS